MNTKKFIEKHAQRIKDGGKLVCRNGSYSSCAGLVAYQDCIYSYGLHYPLLWQIVTPKGEKLMVCNRTGYSNTTSKHIGKCAGHANIYVCLHGTYINHENVVYHLLREISKIQKEMQAKTRKNTNLYAHLSFKLQQALNYLQRIS